MIASLRASFNASWTEERYERMLAELEASTGPVAFPISETPCFFPASLMRRLSSAGEELTIQALSGDAASAAQRAVPDRYQGPNQGERPIFVQVDFGLTRSDEGTIEPKLVELQAFPSLYAFQPVLADAYASVFELPATLQSHLDGLSRKEYLQIARDAIVGSHDPSEVVLMEIDPERQKTRPDFVMTERLWGVRAIDVGEVVRDGQTLCYRRDGLLTRIRRIYNRVIPDELERKAIALPFDYRDDLDVEWAGHPAWYFRISKFSIPRLRHPAVPRTWFLHEVDALPLDRAQLVLKPLFSFAGGGIVFAPSGEQLQVIPPSERDRYILQERISFEPVIDTPHGLTQAEIRLMYIWTDRLRPVLALIRMGRGQMMGVDHNKGLRWVGASAAFIESVRV
ncbi:MAG TPA: hypothetical protein VEK56_16935 [Vicinamibacterales bacterium]|nr:hypothetical protein [Vicinamibacterales bacterium]